MIRKHFKNLFQHSDPVYYSYAGNIALEIVIDQTDFNY